MDRRRFIVRILGGAVGWMMMGRWSAAGGALTERTSVAARSPFDSTDPKIVRLAEEVFHQCVLGKIRPPEGLLKYHWLQAGTGKAFYGQWIWDTMFVVDLLAILPGQQDLIREIFQNYWDFQTRWNEKRPDYAHDMIACMIDPRKTETWNDTPAYSQIPILGWGLERVFDRNGDKDLLRQCLGPLEKFHEWYWRERDVTNSGLVSVGSYSGVVQDARFETFDYECNLDDLKLTPHPNRRGSGGGNWYGNICLPGITSYLIASERSLVRLAKGMGDTAMAQRRQKRIARSVAAVRKHMWDAESGTFLAVNRDTMEKVRVATIGSWLPLMADVPTPEMITRMARVIMTEHWQTPLPIPTVDRNDKRWVSNSYWRGDVWPAPNYQVASGFAKNGWHNIAVDIADKTVANALKNGVSEHYDSMTGKPLGVPYLGMSCTMLTLMLDGLSSYDLRIRNKKQGSS